MGLCMFASGQGEGRGLRVVQEQAQVSLPLWQLDKAGRLALKQGYVRIGKYRHVSVLSLLPTVLDSSLLAIPWVLTTSPVA